MRIGIIGAGFGGMAAGYYLAKNGLDVTIFESNGRPGGLAIGFKEPRWKWSLEQHYHHWFTSDWSIRNLAKEINHPVLLKRPITSTYIDGGIRQLDSPLSLLRFNKLSLFDRLRMGSVLTYLKLTPCWKSLEGISARKFISKYMGKESRNLLWEPLFSGKFGAYSEEISASWFWARVHKRGSSLGYPDGGFLSFAENLAKHIEDSGGKILYNESVESIYPQNRSLAIKTTKGAYNFDKVICTLPTPLFLKVARTLPDSYVKSLINLKGIGAINLVLSLKKKFLEDGTYWLNMNKKEFPFLSLVEHTNFMDKKYYNEENIVYVGNYLEHSHDYFKKNDEELFFEFFPYLKKINPKFSEKWVNKYYLFKAYFAQPIFPLNYSKVIPGFKTPVEGLYLSNIQQVYPWDRGTNYAVELGQKVANMILELS